MAASELEIGFSCGRVAKCEPASRFIQDNQRATIQFRPELPKRIANQFSDTRRGDILCADLDYARCFGLSQCEQCAKIQIMRENHVLILLRPSHYF
jgi:hypothetical protein